MPKPRKLKNCDGAHFETDRQERNDFPYRTKIQISGSSARQTILSDGDFFDGRRTATRRKEPEGRGTAGATASRPEVFADCVRREESAAGDVPRRGRRN